MKIKCLDGIVRRFSVAVVDWPTSGESRCEECGEEFGINDTAVLKPRWLSHTCGQGGLVVDFKKLNDARKAKKAKEAARQAPLPGAAKGQKGRLPVAPVKAKPRLAGRGGEKLVSVVSDFGEALEDLPDLATQLVAINKQKADLEIEAGLLRRAIRGVMEAVNNEGSWTVRDEDTEWIATYIKPKPGKKLVPEKLLLAGVTKKQLEKGYKEVPAKDPYVQVRTKGEDTSTNEEHE